MNLIYPIFLKVSYFAKTEFWKRLFENMAYNNPPQCVYLRSRTGGDENLSLLYHHKKRGFIYYIQEQEPKQLYEEIKKLLITNVKIYSLNDKPGYNNISTVNFSNWNGLKKTFIKNYLVIKYVMEKLNPSTANEAKILINKINLGLSFKTINTKNITMNSNSVETMELSDI